MSIPTLTVNDLEGFEITLASVVISSPKINHRITYSVKNSMYTVYAGGTVVATKSNQQNALDFYNEMNEKIDHLW